MIRLDPDQYSSIAHLLGTTPFNVLMAQAVVDRRVEGVVLVDADPAMTVYVRHKYGMSFLIGYSSDALTQRDVIAQLLDSGNRSTPEWLQVYPLDWTELLDPLATTGQLTKWGRTNFWFNKTRFLTRCPRHSSEYKTVQCTSAELEQFPGSVLPKFFWDDADDFLVSQTGFFSLDPATGEPAAIAFASYLDDNFLEIGVETIPKFRGRGHARIACARLIHLCLERDLIPVWSCRTENEGSFRLAESLGLVPVLQLPYYELATAD